jgi:hypothetical protein
MSDLLEEAAERTELLLQQSLSVRQPVPAKTGYCLFCEEEISGAFCSNECRDDWEHQEKIRKMSGLG